MDNKLIQNNKANCSKFAFLKNNCEDSKAFIDSKTKLHKVSGIFNINQKEFRIEFHTLST